MKQKSNIVIIYCLIISFFACSSERKTAEDFGEFALYNLISNKDVKELFLTPKDSSSLIDERELKWLRNITAEPELLEEYNKQINEDIEQWRK
jgi:hypothetical protein